MLIRLSHKSVLLFMWMRKKCACNLGLYLFLNVFCYYRYIFWLLTTFNEKRFVTCSSISLQLHLFAHSFTFTQLGMNGYKLKKRETTTKSITKKINRTKTDVRKILWIKSKTTKKKRLKINCFYLLKFGLVNVVVVLF